MITINGRPFTAIDDIGFRFFLDPILHNLKLHGNSLSVSNDSLKRYIDEYDDKIIYEIKLQTAEKLISLEYDLCTKFDRQFIGIVIHYFWKNERKSRLISIRRIENSATSVILFRIINEVLAGYNIKLNQIVSITTDNGANVVKAARIFKAFATNSIDEYLHEDEFILDDIIDLKLKENIELPVHIRCAAHLLQLAVKDTMKNTVYDDVIKKARSLVSKIRGNVKLMTSIEKKGILKPIIDVPTRWCSTYKMVINFYFLVL